MTTGDLYRSVDRIGAREAVVRRIQDLIVANKLAPGDPLPPERELAARLSVSRNVLREGLRTLSQKGLVRVVAGRGAFVEAPTGRVVSESLALLLQLRQVSLIELCDARLLIERNSPGWRRNGRPPKIWWRSIRAWLNWPARAPSRRCT